MNLLGTDYNYHGDMAVWTFWQLLKELILLAPYETWIKIRADCLYLIHLIKGLRYTSFSALSWLFLIGISLILSTTHFTIGISSVCFRILLPCRVFSKVEPLWRLLRWFSLIKYPFVYTMIVSFIVCCQLMQLYLRVKMLRKHSVKVISATARFFFSIIFLNFTT